MKATWVPMVIEGVKKNNSKGSTDYSEDCFTSHEYRIPDNNQAEFHVTCRKGSEHCSTVFLEACTPRSFLRMRAGEFCLVIQ